MNISYNIFERFIIRQTFPLLFLAHFKNFNYVAPVALFQTSLSQTYHLMVQWPNLSEKRYSQYIPFKERYDYGWVTYVNDTVEWHMYLYI